jgi:hypothetical protein
LSSSLRPFLLLFPPLNGASSSTTISDVVTINLDDALILVEKRGRGWPRGSKNKVKIPATTSMSTTLVKHRCGCPLGSKNKKSSDAAIVASATPDVGLAQPVLPQRSFGNTFCFFAFADTQCRERQNLPLKFAEFMDGCEIS